MKPSEEIDRYLRGTERAQATGLSSYIDSLPMIIAVLNRQHEELVQLRSELEELRDGPK